LVKHTIKHLRTLALVGQAGCGKTSLAEALLAHAGAIPAAGSVERGTTTCDYTPLEKQFQHSLKLAVASFEVHGGGQPTDASTFIHMLDTPGYADFLGHALPALAAVETAAVVINAQNGIEMMTGRFMQWAGKRGVDRLIVVNRIDADGVDLEGLLAEIRETFGKECLPLNLPAAGATKVSDCFFAPSGESDFSSVEAAHRALVDQVVEVDEKLMAEYLEKGEIEPEALHEPLEAAMRDGHLIPVVFCSAKTGAGIPELLDVIVKLLPNPAEGNPPVYRNVPVDGGAPSAPARAAPHAYRPVLSPVPRAAGGGPPSLPTPATCQCSPPHGGRR
jgi:elongation factor G